MTSKAPPCRVPPDHVTADDLLRECVREMALARGNSPATLAEMEARAWLEDANIEGPFRMTPAAFRAHRKDRLRMTQAELAAALEITSMTVRNYERGKYPVPRIVVLAVYALETLD